MTFHKSCLTPKPLVPNDTEGQADVFLADRQDGTIVRVSQNASGQGANKYSQGPVLSADGHYVFFSTDANNLILGFSLRFHIYRFDRISGELVMVTRNPAGVMGNGDSGRYFLDYRFGDASFDGKTLAFISSAANLATFPYPPNGPYDQILVACIPSPTPTVSATPTRTATFDPAPPTETPTSYIVIDEFPTHTPTASATPTDTGTWTPTFTVTDTPTETASSTSSDTPTETMSPTVTDSPTVTLTPTVTETSTLTVTPTVTPLLEAIIGDPWPNPVTGGTLTMALEVPGTSLVSWELFTTAFRLLLSDSQPVTTGKVWTWDLRDQEGERVGNGLYFLRVKVVGKSSTTKVMKVLVLR